MQPSEYQNETSGELPSPQAGYDQSSPETPEAPHEQQQGAAIEQGMSPAPQDDQSVALPPQVPPPVMPGQVPNDTPDLATPQSGMPLPAIADDNDLIEKEWVTKAKHIVEQTKHDPYAQNQEVNKMKADYLKKRYNKDLKLSDS